MPLCTPHPFLTPSTCLSGSWEFYGGGGAGCKSYLSVANNELPPPPQCFANYHQQMTEGGRGPGSLSVLLPTARLYFLPLCLSVTAKAECFGLQNQGFFCARECLEINSGDTQSLTVRRPISRTRSRSRAKSSSPVLQRFWPRQKRVAGLHS